MIFYYRRLLTALHLIKLMKLKTFISAKLISNLKLHAAIEDTKKEKKKKGERMPERCVSGARHSFWIRTENQLASVSSYFCPWADRRSKKPRLQHCKVQVFVCVITDIECVCVLWIVRKRVLV